MNWVIVCIGQRVIPQYKIIKDDTLICTEITSRANAELIAAAPEMLEALRLVVANLKAHGNATPLLFGALVKAELAVAKAEGSELGGSR